MQFITQYILRVIIWNFTLLGRDGSLSQSRQHIGAFYEDLEVALNAGQVELLDLSKLRRELLTIVRRGASLDHMPGAHDDWATSAAGALTLVNPDIGNTEPGILAFYR